MRLEGGFQVWAPLPSASFRRVPSNPCFISNLQGRTNKLVDGCYSFWVGAVFPLLARHLSTEKQVLETGWLYEQSGCSGGGG